MTVRTRAPPYFVIQYDVKDGSVFEVAASLNRVQYTPVTMGNGTVVDAPGSSSSGSRSSSSSAGSAQRTGSVSSTSNNNGAASVGMQASTAAGLLALLMASLVIL